MMGHIYQSLIIKPAVEKVITNELSENMQNRQKSDSILYKTRLEILSDSRPRVRSE